MTPTLFIYYIVVQSGLGKFLCVFGGVGVGVGGDGVGGFRFQCFQELYLETRHGKYMVLNIFLQDCGLQELREADVGNDGTLFSLDHKTLRF